MKDDRKRQPEVAIPERVEIPADRVRTLDNGVKLYTLPATGDGVVRVSFVFRAGSALQEVPFSASATANLLSEGTARYTAHQIAEELDFYGSYYDASIDRDYAVITFCALSRHFKATLALAAEIVLHPAFPEHEVEIYRIKRKQQLAVERSKAAFQARELFTQSLFGKEHPYGTSSPEALYDDLTRQAIEAFYRTHYTANNCFVVASGDVDDAVTDRIADLAAQIPRGAEIPGAPFPAPACTPSAERTFPDAVQSAIRIGRVLFPRSHPDFVGMQVLATILGGYFGSRLVRNLREERGYTYGVFAAMINLDRAGYLAISTEVTAAATREAVAQIFAEMERLRTEPVPQAELAMVKNMVVGEVMRILDGPFGIADITIENIQNRNDNSYLNEFLACVRAATPQDIQQLAQKYLDPAAFTTVIVGAV